MLSFSLIRRKTPAELLNDSNLSYTNRNYMKLCTLHILSRFVPAPAGARAGEMLMELTRMADAIIFRLQKIYRLKYKLSFKTIALFALIFLNFFSLKAATYYSRQNGNWNANATWSTVACGGAAAAGFPGAADNVIICAGHTVNVNVNSSCASLTMYCGAVVGSGLTGTFLLTLGGDVTVTDANTGTSAAVISCPVSLTNSATRTFSVADDGTTATDLVISGVISSSGSLIKAGDGTMELSGSNTYSGATTISGGTVLISNSNALGTTAGGTTVISGASLQLQGGITVGNEVLSLAGEGIPPTNSSGALLNVSGNNSWSGAILITANNTRINSSSGSLTLFSAINIQNYTLFIQGVSSNNNLISGIISGTGNVQKVGTGLWSLSAANDFTGGFALYNGTLNINNSAALGTIAGTITIGGVGNQVTLDNTSGSGLTILNYQMFWADDFTFTGTNDLNLGAGTVTMTASRTVTTNAKNLTVGGNITGAFTLIKAGTGTMTLTGNNTFSGGLTLNAGILQLGGANERLNNSLPVTLNGGSFSSGAAAGYSETMGTLALADNSSIALGTGSHSLIFSASNAVGWAAGKILSITGWTGSIGGTGASGRVFIGNNATGLTTDQLSQIRFLVGGHTYRAVILSTGEIIPAYDIITTLAVTGFPLCAGTAGILVPFTYTLPSNFPSGTTTFTAQLSDASGSFVAPKTLQSILSNGTGSQTISVTIPVGTPSGNAYRIRVISINPSVTGTDNGTDLTINALPSAVAGANRAICLGSNTQLGAAAVAGNTYSWTSVPAGFTSNLANPTVSPTVTTTYTLTETITASGCSMSNSVVVTVNLVPAAAAGVNRAICSGNSTQIGAASVSGNTYSWTSVPAGFTSTLSNPTVSPTVTTTYLLTETITSTGCSNSNSVMVTVNPLPAANAGVNQTICSGNSTQIGTASVTGNTYSWTSLPSGFTSTLSNPTVSPTVTTTYTLTETITATGCTKSNTVVVTVNPVPAAATGANRAICFGNSTQIGASSVLGNTYSWTSVPAGFTSTLSNPTVSPAVTTIYILTETITATGCSKSNSVVITVNPLPAANAGVNQTICFGSSTQIGAVSVPGSTYSWTSLPAGFTSTQANPTVFPSVTTTYTLTETITATGCTKSNSVVVTVNPAASVNAGPDQSVCASSPSVTLAGSYGGSATSASWSGGSGAYNPGPGTLNAIYTPSAAEIAAGNVTLVLTTNDPAGPCPAVSDAMTITIKPLPAATAVPTSLYVYSGTSTYITLGSTPSGALFTWVATGNTAFVTGFSSQGTPVAGPIVQQLFNTGGTVGEVTYVITPILNGCAGSPITVVIIVPNKTFCSNTESFPQGSCIIDMGVTPQTEANGLKPYGLLYQLVNIYRVPVYWSINPGKSYVNAAAKVDETDFSLDGISFKGGPFIIPVEYLPQVQSVIDSWVAQGVSVHYAAVAFSPPVHDLISFLPNVVLDAANGALLQAAFYTKAGIPSSAYKLGGIPSIITDCDDIYVLPHADPQNWSQFQKDSLYNFINLRGSLFVACHAVSAIESIFGGTPQKKMNFLSNSGLVLWGSHANPTPPFNYTINTAPDPQMQFVGTLDHAVISGSEEVFIPLSAGWRPTTTISVFDPNYPLGTYSSPGPAAEIAYGKAYGDPDNGMVMYMAGHNFQAGTIAENVALARVYGNFWIEAGIASRPRITPVSIPDSAFSGETVTFSVNATTTTPPLIAWEWSSDCDGIFTSPNSTTSGFIAPSVDVTTDCHIQFKVTDYCGRVGYYCTALTILPTLTNNHIAASQTICPGQTPATLTGSVPVVPNGNTFTYQWLSSTTGSASGFSPASGINNQQNYSPGALNQTTWYRREVTCNGITVVSASIQITIKPAPTVTATATPATICAGQSSSLASSGTGLTSTTLTLSNTQDYNIPNNSAAGVFSEITVAGGPTSMAGLTSISVTVNVTHDKDQQVELYLVRPLGNITTAANGIYLNTTVPGESLALVAHQGGDGNNFTNTVFSDAATQSIVGQAAPFTGTFKPQERALSSLTGDPNGIWKLKALDNQGGAGGTGKLNDWTITMTFATGLTYSWSSNPAGFTSTLQNPGSVSPAVTTLYTVTVTEPGITCTGSSSVLVTMNTPVVSSQATSTCSATPFTVTPAAVPSGTTYTWPSPVVTGGMTGGAAGAGAASISGTLTNPTGTTQTATYTVTPKAGSCTGSTFTVTVTVFPLPQGSLSANGPFCATGTGMLTWTATSGTGPFSVDYNDGTAIRTQNGVISGVAFNVFTNPVIATTTYTLVSVTDSKGCSRNSGFTVGSATITVNPLPQGSLTANGPFCASGSGQLTWTTSSGTGPYTIIYYNGTSNQTALNVLSGTPFNVVPSTVTSTTTYSLVSVIGANGCTRTSGFTIGSATIIVNSSPVILSQPVSQTVCPGSSVSFTVTASGTPTPTYQWRKDGNPIGGATSSSYTINPVNAGNLGTYNVIVSNSCGSVTSNPATLSFPSALDPGAHNTTPLTECSGYNPANLIFTTLPSGGLPPYTYQWQLNGNPIPGETGNTYDPPQLLVPGIYSYNCKVSDACGTTGFTVAKVITIVADPTVSISGAGTVCQNVPVLLTALIVGGTGTSTYQWQSGPAISGPWTSVPGATNATYSPATGTAGTVYYKVIIHSGGAGCDDPICLPVAVTVNALPVCSVSGPVSVCPASTNNSFSGPAGMSTYTWTLSGNGSITAGAGTRTLTVTAAAACNVSFTLSLAVTDGNGCSSSCSHSVSITDNTPPSISCPLPVVQIPDPGKTWATITLLPPSCSDNCSSTASLTLSWTMSGTTTGTGSGTIPPSYVFNEGNTLVTYQVTDACGNSAACSFTVEVSSNDPPLISCPANISVNTANNLCSSSLDPGQPFLISGTAPITWSWVMSGANAGSGTGRPITPNPFTFNAGITTISWTATNIAGLSSCTQAITVTDNQPPTFTPPSLASGYCVLGFEQAIFHPGGVYYVNDLYYPDGTTPARRDYYLFPANSTELDISNVSDNCGLASPAISWSIDFGNNGSADLGGVGQLSLFGEIHFPIGDNKITWTVTDIHGNTFSNSVILKVFPRPDLN